VTVVKFQGVPSELGWPALASLAIGGGRQDYRAIASYHSTKVSEQCAGGRVWGGRAEKRACRRAQARPAAGAAATTTATSSRASRAGVARHVAQLGALRHGIRTAVGQTGC